MDSAKLRDRIVSVFDENLLVQVFCTGHPDGCVKGLITADVEFPDEFIEEQSAEALGAAAVAGKKCTLDNFGEIDESENWRIQVGEIPPENVGLGWGEFLGHVDRHGRPCYESDR